MSVFFENSKLPKKKKVRSSPPGSTRVIRFQALISLYKLLDEERYQDAFVRFARAAIINTCCSSGVKIFSTKILGAKISGKESRIRKVEP